MNWNEAFTQDTQPNSTQISAHISNPLWGELCTHIEQNYGVPPRIEYSICSGAPGWNVKYKKSSRALCTLYPNQGFFTCLVCIGTKEAMGAELLLGSCTEEVRTRYWQAKPFNGARWLMIDVTSEEVLEDVKKLISLRAPAKK